MQTKIMEVDIAQLQCSQCGGYGLHACPGEPIRPWTIEEREQVKQAFEKITQREAENGKQ